MSEVVVKKKYKKRRKAFIVEYGDDGLPTIECLYRMFELTDDGALIYKVRRGGRAIVGRHVGCVTLGYLKTQIEDKPIFVHRIVFAMHNGRWPELEIDHIDRNKLNNRPENLREVTHKENMLNMSVRANSKTGTKGVYFCNRQRQWTASGGRKHLGYFDDIDDAIAARKDWEIRNHGHLLCRI